MTPILVLLLAAPVTGVKVPDGFTVSLVAGADVANDIHCMTATPDGGIVVSGRGYVRQLSDEGKLVREFAGAPKDGAMGLFWEKGDLYCVGDGGLKVWRDAVKNHARPPEVIYKCKTGGEHTSHAVQRGPDGWMYLLVGDGTGITAKHVTGPLSPVKEPIGGCVLRFSPDWKQCEVHSHGFRNAYGMDFGCDGEVYTYDSDNERCVGLPWYEGTRFYRAQEGGFHGWLGPNRAATWRMPPHFPDVVPPVADFGRGSPTGVACYRHAQFPEKYRGGFFLCDWTFGVVHFAGRPSEWQGVTSARHDSQPFLKATGDEGFAPVAAAVSPKTGDLLLAIGGRGTRGAVYRVRYDAGFGKVDAKAVEKLQPRPRSLEWGRSPFEKKGGGGAGGSEGARRFQEYALRHHARLTPEQRRLAYRTGANHGGIHRYLAARLLSLAPEAERRGLMDVKGLSEWERTTQALGVPTWEVSGVAANTDLTADYRVSAVRLVQVRMGAIPPASARGTVWEGYTRSGTDAVPDSTRADLRKAFPSRYAEVDFELARALAMMEDDSPAVLKAMAAKLTPDFPKPYHHIHYLACFARLKGERTKEMTEATVKCLLALDELFPRRDSNWAPRVAEIHALLSQRDPALNSALLSDDKFGRPAHALFTRVKGFDRLKAAEVFLKKADARFEWDVGLARLVAELPPEKSLPALRKLWGLHGIDEELAVLLAKHAKPEDHKRLLTGVGSARLSVVGAALTALEKLPTQERPEAEALIVALRQLPADKTTAALRARLLARLEKATGNKEKRLDDWAIWAAEKWPTLARKLLSPDGVDEPAWKKRLAGVDWDRGDAARGAAVYTKASCASCHGGAAALGPDLAGVTGRFSRDDLFTAIVRPSKDVAERYRTTRIATESGHIYQGIVVYEAIDSILLLTGPAQTARVAHKQIASKTLTPLSLMPTGLLDTLKDGEIADLYAHLRAMKK